MTAAGVFFMLGTLHAQTDPGPRSPIATAIVNARRLPLADSVDMQKFWGGGQKIFEQTFSVSGALPNEPGSGLGPGFNSNSCVSCHFQPTVGGTSPITNPQVAVANLDGASNSLSILPFITADGPVREARFVDKPNGTPDGGVHNLFTIAGRTDAPGCNLTQPDFTDEVADNNVIFRIPTPLFGLGLVENTPDSVLQANLAAEQVAAAALGIHGTFNIQFNTSGNDGTIDKFGWKAQNKSLLMFAGEAMNVELGATNELFTNERNEFPGCIFNPTSEDFTTPTGPNGTPGDTTGTATQMASNLENIVVFMRFNAPPPPVPGGFTTVNGTPVSATSIANGMSVFNSIGCAVCHSPQLTTAASHFEDLSNQTYNPFSDFALHKMGVGLADGVTQGQAGPQHFRTAPLWGVGQRLFFLHDGRTSDLFAAISAHKSDGSEANKVINNFNNQSASNQQDILNFLRSL